MSLPCQAARLVSRHISLGRLFKQCFLHWVSFTRGTLLDLPYLELVTAFGYPLLGLYAVFAHTPTASAPTLATILRVHVIKKHTDHNPSLVLLLATFGFIIVMPIEQLSILAIVITLYYHLDYPESKTAFIDVLDDLATEVESNLHAETNTADDSSEMTPDSPQQETQEDAAIESGPTPETTDTEKVDVLEYQTSTGPEYRFVESGRGEQEVDAYRNGISYRKVLLNLVPSGTISGLSYGVIAANNSGHLDVPFTIPIVPSDYVILVVLGIAAIVFALASRVHPPRNDEQNIPRLDARSIHRDEAVRMYPNHDE